MNLKTQAATTTTAAAPEHQHSRKANFGSLVSAIRHGDLGAAQTAFDALQGSDRFGANGKGDLGALGQAIASGDPEAAKKALKTFQQSKGVQPTVATPTAASTPTPTETTASTGPTVPAIPTVSTPGSMVNIIV